MFGQEDNTRSCKCERCMELMEKEAMNHAKENKSNLHLYGLCSNGGVHSHIEHLFALLEMAKREGLEKVFVHVFLDGRDVNPKSAITYLDQIENATISTISGRYYAMDRDNNFDRLKKSYDAICYGEGKVFNSVDNKL